MSDIRRPSDPAHPDELLAGHVDGTLTAADRADLQAHLDGCAQCRAELELAGSAAAALRALPDLDAPWGLGREAIEESRKVRRNTGGARRWTAVAGVAAAAVLLVGLGVAVLRGPQGDAGGAAAPATTETQPKSLPTPNAAGGTGAQDSAAGIVERQGQRNYQPDDVEGLAQFWAGKARSYRSAAPPAPTSAPQAPTTAATTGATSGAATSAAFSGPEGPTGATSGGTMEASALRDAESMISCIDRAAELEQSERPVRVIVARFEEKPALFGIFLNGPGAGQPADLVVVWVTSTDCHLLHYASHRISP